jgi:hypothetical protein
MSMRILAVLLFALALLLAFTNPGPERFEHFVDEVVTQILVAEAGHLPGSDRIAIFGGALAGRMAREYALRDNYILFSVYKLDMSVIGLRGEEWRFLGIGGRFIELRRPASLQ